MAEERSGGSDLPALRGFVVTPTDGVDLQALTRMVWIGGAGNLNCILANDGTPTLLSGIPAGVMLNLRVKQILSTSTTATLIVGLY